MGPTSSSRRAKQVRLRRVVVLGVAFVAAQGCASIAGLESLEIAAVDASVAGGSAGDSATSTESGDSPAAGGHDASTGGTGGSAGSAATGGASGTAGTAGAGGVAGSAGIAGAAGNQGCGGAFACVPPPDGQWSSWSVGSFAQYVMSSCGQQAGVIATYYDASKVPDEAPAQCSCGCAPPTGECTSDLRCSPNTSCGMALDVGLVSSTCATYNSGLGVGACIAESPSAQATCALSPTKSIPESGWTINASTCMAASDAVPTCEGDGRCVEPAPVGAHGPCVSAKGDIPCPASKDWAVRFLVYEGVADTRDCNPSGCACLPVDVLCSCDNGCTLNVTANGCGGIILGTFKPDGSCKQLSFTPPSQVGVVLHGADMPPNVQCAPTGESMSVGKVTGTTPVTVCCKE